MNDKLFQDSEDRRRANGPADPDVPDLTQADGAALDALINSGWNADAANPRSAHIASFLSMLAPPPSAVGTDDALIDLTLARVARARRAEAATQVGPGAEVLALSPDDEDAVEQYIASGFSIASVSASYRARAQRADDLLRTLDLPAPDAADREALVAGTLNVVQRAVEKQERRMVLDPAESAPGRGFRFADLVSVAALILIGTAVIGPMVGSVRAFGQRLACTAGFGELAGAFGQYTHDFRDTLPMATASIAGRPWWNVGNPEESNSANLYTLARTNYTKAERLACPTNDRSRRCSKRSGESDWHCIDEVSYSYQNLFARARPKWHEGRARVAILVDRSPVVLLSARKASIDPFSNSPNHGRAGQNALFNDGSVTWLSSPVLDNGDNIWLPRVVERAIADRACRSRKADPLRGTESPECAEDTFVGP